MRSPIFSPRQFLDPTTLNTSFSTVLNGVADAFGYSTTSQGLLNPSDLSFSSSGLNLTVTANPPFAILFGNGIVAPFLGMSSGGTTNSVTLNLSSYVPSTGSQTVYIIGTPIQISLDPTIIYGPPIGDPNYSTLFSPTQAYTTSAYSIGVSATTTAPNNSSQMELGRLTLSAGATTLPAVDTAYQPLVSFSITNTAVIDTLGYVPLSSGIFSSANTWTGSNNFTGGLSISGYPFSLSSPATNDVLYWNGTDFVVGPDPILALNNTWSGTTNTFDGSVTAQSFNTSSSLAIKSDVSDLGTETAEEFIQNLRPVTFRYRESLDDGKEHVGLIAEEVSHINPAFAPNGKSVSYAEITATLIKTVQTLMKRVDELSQKLEGRLP
jgi:hypothetical protein